VAQVCCVSSAFVNTFYGAAAVLQLPSSSIRIHVFLSYIALPRPLRTQNIVVSLIPYLFLLPRRSVSVKWPEQTTLFYCPYALGLDAVIGLLQLVC
jgi:hypothetical protein